MRKSKKTLKIEERIGEPIETYLERECKERRDINLIARNLHVSPQSVNMWLHYHGIYFEDSQAIIEEDQSILPKKEYLEERINTGWTISRIAKEVGIYRQKVGELIKKYGIQGGYDNKEKRKKDVEILLERIEKSPEELNTTDFERKVREGGRSYKGILTWYKRKHECSSLEAIGILLEELYDIRLEKLRRINGRRELLKLLQQDETARNLAIAATTMNGEAYDIEKILAELYDQQFPDIQRLHQLLQDSRLEIKKLVQEGVTNLGYFIGPYDQGDKKIVPTLLGYVIATIPEEQLTPTLEDRLIRALRNEYSPRFNEDSERTMQEIYEKAEGSEGRKQGLYQRLYDHYKEVLELGRELSS